MRPKGLKEEVTMDMGESRISASFCIFKSDQIKREWLEGCKIASEGVEAQSRIRINAEDTVRKEKR